MNNIWILDEFDEIIYVSDMETYDILYMNDRCLNLTGLTKETYTNVKCFKALQNFDSPCPFCNNHKLSKERFYKWEFTNPHLRSTYSIKDKIIDWNGRDARIEVATDITNYKDQISKAELEMSLLIKSIPGGICLLANDGKSVLWHNDHFLELLGYTEEQFVNELKSKTNYIYKKDVLRVKEALEKAKKTGIPLTLETRMMQRCGKMITLMTTLSYIKMKGHDPVFYSIGINITGFKRKEEQSKKALQNALTEAQQANLAKSRFLSRMSHEIRTPLNAVIGMAAIASSDLTNPDLQRDCHKKIDSAANYLLSLVNDILDVSRIESGKMDLSNHIFLFPHFLRGVVGLFSDQTEKRGICFEITCEPLDEESLLGDSLRLKQVLVNLLSNAFKFTDNGGTIGLHVRQLSLDQGTAWFEFTVIDTGIGIKSAFLSHIFGAFEQQDSETTSRYGGSGLGLPICKKIVEMMQGRLEVFSKEGKGSRFVVTVPLEVSASESDINNQMSLEHLKNKHVLVADDAASSLTLGTMLHRLGMRSTMLPAGKDVFDVIESAHALGQPFDVALLSDTLVKINSAQDQTRAARLKALTGVAFVGITSLPRLFSATHEVVNENNLLTGEGPLSPFVLLSKPFFYSSVLQALDLCFKPEAEVETVQVVQRDFSGKRLLLVEDNEINLEIACELLKGYHFVIETATNGQESVDLFKDKPLRYFDAILMDIRMPIMDGLTAARQIRQLNREDARTVPIIALSANAFDEDKEKSKASGMNAHISKPIDMDELCEELAQAIR